MEENIIKELMTSLKCGVCGQPYGIDNIIVLAHEDGLWFLEASCLACDTHCLVAAVMKEDKVAKVVTDLTEAECGDFESDDGPTVEDMLDMHDFLKHFDGDFSRLFHGRKA